MNASPFHRLPGGGVCSVGSVEEEGTFCGNPRSPPMPKGERCAGRREERRKWKRRRRRLLLLGSIPIHNLARPTRRRDEPTPGYVEHVNFVNVFLRERGEVGVVLSAKRLKQAAMQLIKILHDFSGQRIFISSRRMHPLCGCLSPSQRNLRLSHQ